MSASCLNLTVTQVESRIHVYIHVSVYMKLFIIYI